QSPTLSLQKISEQIIWILLFSFYFFFSVYFYGFDSSRLIVTRSTQTDGLKKFYECYSNYKTKILNFQQMEQNKNTWEIYFRQSSF
ncbi:MAG: hypothetical protein LBC20_09280, partial [Planctomycetaceae bacterium]|nr:hypothetical protein [Planctomycetaceae bacterium]